MAHGLPDWYRGVDIAYQALAEIINRPKYGECDSVSFSGNAWQSSEKTIATVTGKGVTYGGYVFSNPDVSQKNDIIRVYVDGSLVANASFYILQAYNINSEYTAIAYLKKYDDAGFVYVVGISAFITFESLFQLAYLEQHGNQPLYGGRLNYALI